MANTIFVSPGVYTKEQDFTLFASRIGLTRLGLVGKTMKGPAFEPVSIRTTDEFLLRFGSTNPKYPLPYVANSFLSQSNELTVTRVLGKEGFVNSPAWLIVADDSTTYGGSASVSGISFSVTGLETQTIYTFDVAEIDMPNGTVSSSTVGDTVTINYSGSVTSSDIVTALAADSTYVALGISTSGGDSTTIADSTFYLSGDTQEARGQYSGSTLAILRSKRNQIDGSWYFDEESDITLGNITGPLNSFTLSATTGPLTAETNSGITISLDETRQDYIANLLSKNPKVVDNTTNLYVERIYPHFIREAVSRGDITGIKAVPVFTEEASYTDFQTSYTNAITPWIVSRVIGGEAKRLFRVQTVSDGDYSSAEIKISIANIDIVNNTFDLIVRRFDDTDKTASQTALERWSSLSLREGDSTFIGKVIGTTDEEYPRKSNFITVDLAENIPTNTVPAGFEEFEVRGSTTFTELSGHTAGGGIYYKTEYFSGDSIFRTYLGMSELGYTSYTQDQVSVKNSVKTLERDLFAFDGSVSTGTSIVKGFHLENTANSAKFVSGDKDSITGYTNAAGTLIDKNKLKFTVVPLGGFDGWDKYLTITEPYEEFTDAYTANVNAFKEAIATFENPEEVDINVFATPGVDYSNNETIIKYALEKMEDRADTLYIIDAPRISTSGEKGTPEEAVSRLEATGIDSNYAATYWPWIQIEDPNSGQYTYQSPTMMAVQALAYTDNVANPWFAPAGLNRGLAGTRVIRTDIKVSANQRDTLYEGRINPIASFVQQGIVIFGQKTLQSNQSALDRINVRRLLLQVRRLISAASLTLLFEQNDQTLRDQFLAKVEPILLQIQNQRGLTAFKVVMDESNNGPEVVDRNTLVGKIQLQPTKTAEFIDLTFQVLPTGANFEDF
jgi:hypothetical protein